MDRNLLASYLKAGLSLPQIGALENRDPSTVGYWVAKHGLRANGRERFAPRGGLTRGDLEPLVEGGQSVAEMARRLDRSGSTVRYWLKRFDLSPEERKRRRPALAAADRAGLDRAEAECRRHGLVEWVRRPDGGWRCGRCRSEDVSNWRRRAKRKLVELAGGCCAICGYDRYMGALQFHHRDPSTKAFALSRKGHARAFAELEAEAAKCVLLCANCHAEVEGGYAKL